jgi:predicted outer membrane repeat protein
MKRLRKPFSIIAGVALLVSPALPTSARAQAQPITLYAYAGAPTSALRTCPLTSAPGLQCSLGKALSLAVGGDVIALATPNGRGDYVGNWDVDTKGTSSRAPLTIEQAPNMIASPLDGNDGRRAGCGTAACDGPVLDVGGDVFFSLLDVEVDDADDTTTYGGGAVQNSQGGSVTVSGSVFYYDTAGAGGAIDNGDQGGHGSLYVTASSFIGDSARGGQVEDGGAIDNGDNGGHGTAYVGGSTFMDDSAASDGGAIDNGDGTGVRPGAGALKVTTSTFMGNQAGQNGGAIDSDDVAVIPNSANWAAKPGTLRVSLSTFWDNSARFWGGAIGSGESPLGSGPGSTVVGQSSLAANTALFGGDLYGDNSVTVGGDLLADGCSATNGTARTSWSDAGYNVGENATCFAKGRGDISQVQLPRFIGRPAPNGGTTETLMPLAGSAAVGAVPYATTVDLAGTDVALCPTKDQRGIASSPGQPCDSGAVQLGGGAPAAPGPTATLYAYAGATGAGLPSCPPTSDKARRCDLGEAVSSALPGDIVALAGPGKDPRYTGNWTISTPLTTAQSPITIEPAPGTGRPVLDGNDGRRRGCTTTLCDGPVLQVGYREYLVIRGVSVQDAANLVTGQGGAIDNLGGTVAIDGSSFSHDDAAMGGAPVARQLGT